MDFKNSLDNQKLYLIKGKVYNRNETGNFVWAYFLRKHHFGGFLSAALAQAGSLIHGRADEPWDARARWRGILYFYGKGIKGEL